MLSDFALDPGPNQTNSSSCCFAFVTDNLLSNASVAAQVLSSQVSFNFELRHHCVVALLLFCFATCCCAPPVVASGLCFVLLEGLCDSVPVVLSMVTGAAHGQMVPHCRIFMPDLASGSFLICYIFVLY